LNGSIQKRKKKLSKKVYGTSHKISLEEAKYVYEKGTKLLIIGAGQYGRVVISEEAKKYINQKDCRVKLMATSEAIKSWNTAAEKVIHIGVFHGTFDDENETLFPGTPESRFLKLAKDSPFQVHIMGHSHVPYYKIVSGVHFVNPGSVGRMFHGDPRTSFSILKVSAEGIKLEHFRIPYPVDEVIKGLKKNHLPDIYTKIY
jgi:hypothetical protein